MDTDIKNNNGSGSSSVNEQNTGVFVGDKSEITIVTSDKPWQFQKGNPGGPGRPVGKTLKEWVRDQLANMSDEERLEFLKAVPREIQWKMAEGQPHQSSDQEHKGEININISKEISDKHETNSSTSDNS